MEFSDHPQLEGEGLELEKECSNAAARVLAFVRNARALARGAESRAFAAYLEDLENARGRPDFRQSVTVAGLRYVVGCLNANAENSLPDFFSDSKQIEEFRSLLELFSDQLKTNLIPRLSELEQNEEAKRRFITLACVELTRRMHQLHADACLRLTQATISLPRTDTDSSSSIGQATTGNPIFREPELQAVRDINESNSASDRRRAVDAYIDEVFRTTGRRITRTDIWKNARYSSRTEFERWERNDRKKTNKAAHERFTRILKEKPHLN